jgi:hypothetical protein
MSISTCQFNHSSLDSFDFSRFIQIIEGGLLSFGLLQDSESMPKLSTLSSPPTINPTISNTQSMKPSTTDAIELIAVTSGNSSIRLPPHHQFAVKKQSCVLVSTGKRIVVLFSADVHIFYLDG